jgi:DNA replication and repair protein RecF
MNLTLLRLQSLRCIAAQEIDMENGINLFIGANGSGKTSVLEAIYLLSRGRSFRTAAKDALLRRGDSQLTIFAELHHQGQVSRLGLGRQGARWQAKLDGETAALSEFLRACAVVCFEPGSHALIAGAADERRRYLDWGVFHVEPDFLMQWRRFHRALKQRNSLLRAEGTPTNDIFVPWELELAQAGEQLDVLRTSYLDALRPKLASRIGRLLPELGAATLSYRRGWPEGDALGMQLAASRARDLARGHTTLGAHRADWSITCEQAPLREHLSRGQEKLLALACLLAQAELYADIHAEWPIVCLDDFASELDQVHQAAVVAELLRAQAQILITGTELPQALKNLPARMFHVEQGVLTRLL